MLKSTSKTNKTNQRSRVIKHLKGIRMRNVLSAVTGLFVLLFINGSPYAAPIKSVTVVNTDSEPVPVTIVQLPTAINVCATLGPFSGSSQLIYGVPSDMMLVIEYSSIDPVDTLDDGEFVQVQIRTTAGGMEGTFFAGKVLGSEFTFG